MVVNGSTVSSGASVSSVHIKGLPQAGGFTVPFPTEAHRPGKDPSCLFLGSSPRPFSFVDLAPFRVHISLYILLLIRAPLIFYNICITIDRVECNSICITAGQRIRRVLQCNTECRISDRKSVLRVLRFRGSCITRITVVLFLCNHRNIAGYSYYGDGLSSGESPYTSPLNPYNFTTIRLQSGSLPWENGDRSTWQVPT